MTYSVQGKTVLITGGTGGIGKETARELVKLGAHVIVVGRDKVRGEAAATELRREAVNGAQVDVLYADFSSQASIRQLADEFTRRFPRLDVLVNNVGVMSETRQLTVDGIESSFAVNHLAPFLLTHLLLPALRASGSVNAPARVVNVTGGMPLGRLNMDDLQMERKYTMFSAYSLTKIAMSIASYEFARRLEGTGVTLNVALPGAAQTAMTNNMTAGNVPLFMRVLFPVFRLMMSNATPARAARSSIYLASSPEVEGLNGAYYGPNSRPMGWVKQASDDALRARLWQISETLTGIEGVSSVGVEQNTAQTPIVLSQSA